MTYDDGLARLIQGDALDVMAAMPERSVDCVVTSPPYWGLRLYSGEQERVWQDGWRGSFGNEPSVALFIAHLMEFMAAIKRVLKDTGVCFINLADSYMGSGKGIGSDHGKAVFLFSGDYRLDKPERLC